MLDAVARALQLDDGERQHLFDLVKGGPPVDPAPVVRPGLVRLLDAMTGAVRAALRQPASAELTAASPAFQDLWSRYDLRHRRTGRKRFAHPVAGPLIVDFESMTLVSHPGLRLSAGTAPPETADALRSLVNWSYA